MRLDPVYRQQYLHLLGVASLLAGKYENAAVLLRQRILLVPRTDFTRASSFPLLVILGRSTRPVASGVNLKRSIHNTPSANISPGNLSRMKRMYSGLLRVSRKPDCRAKLMRLASSRTTKNS